MRGTIIRRFRSGAGKLLRDQRGNALMLTAAAVVPLVGIVGSAVDIGRAYMTQLRLQQACDAGVLAGRRAMAGGTYTDAAEAEANKMFDFNFPDGIYGSSEISFASEASSPSDVIGTASARLPTALMQIFGFTKFDLAVNCTAKLEISNADVMMVLDVTGSMNSTNSGDTVNRITALQTAAVDFFDTLTTAEIGDGRLRFGVVPYSSTANVGAILMDKDPDWISDYMLVPSRTPVIRYNWSGGNIPSGVTTGTTSYGDWSTITAVASPSSSFCSGLTPPADSESTSAATPSMNRTTWFVDKNGTRRYVNDNKTVHRRYNYRYTWSDGKCLLQGREVTFTHAAASNPTSSSFENRYRYEDRLFDVSSVKSGSALVTDTGDNGASRSYNWGGCVMERFTEPFDDDETASSDALDMDVDSAPTGDEFTKWQLLIPEVAFPRAASPGSSPSTSGALTVDVYDSYGRRRISQETDTNGSWQNYSRYWSNGWGVCPAAAMKLTTMTAADKSDFEDYINSLKPLGGTYHDAGMVWGVRLLSPDGMFADENAEAPNKRPISRHIIFMTDGEMAPNWGNLTFQGYEELMHRVSGTYSTSLTSLHNNRFQQLCTAAKRKNITVWVVSFGTSLNSSLENCASPGKAYEAKNAASLNENFQAIARQISKLRLSQ
ncbi:TadE/TadG family type IV pilus assembly protein [Sphingopyxis indica]|uniref:Flp pilus assembly protein TadG n=1 Tax=Sphingopyxis indica TaxID=436663 RepID=A0A239HQG3_9SPHN|nr:TadE/TadG family type IV pilus assembly protein [Sphingopyxis indica]SNS83328.1 Flp pilus assembly protein TadG [Sphingopyxis indica]